VKVKVKIFGNSIQEGNFYFCRLIDPLTGREKWCSGRVIKIGSKYSLVELSALGTLETKMVLNTDLALMQHIYGSRAVINP
jgi:hypothetical protein